MKLVQMPTALIHLDDADLDRSGVEPGLLAAFRAYLPRAVEDRRGAAILAPSDAGGHLALMVLARRVGAALRDANIHLRERGGDLKVERQKLCYLPGPALPDVFADPASPRALLNEAACFVQDLDGAWTSEHSRSARLDPAAVLDLVKERLTVERPTFLNADPSGLPAGLERDLRAILPAIEAPLPREPGE